MLYIFIYYKKGGCVTEDKQKQFNYPQGTETVILMRVDREWEKARSAETWRNLWGGKVVVSVARLKASPSPRPTCLSRSLRRPENVINIRHVGWIQQSYVLNMLIDPKALGKWWTPS